jgi:hypothetical protein
MVEDFDPTTIEDEGLRQVVISLMNLVESLSAKVAEQAEEIQRLRDENHRLKGEQGKPKILPNTKANTALSSEKERRVSKAHHKTKKHAQIKIDRVEVVKVEKEHLPADAQFKGYEDVIVQDLEFRPDTIRFRHPKNITHPARNGRIWRLFQQATPVSLDLESEHGSWPCTMRMG